MTQSIKPGGTSVRRKSTPSGNSIPLEIEEAPKHYTSFFVLSYSNPLRRLCRTVTESKIFEYFILAVILVNCILMALNSQLPADDVSEMNRKVEKAEMVLLFIFSTEMVLNVITHGFLLHPGSYLRDAWNILDFVVVITGILSLPGLNLMKGGSVKALRAMRVLRPLKLVSGVPSLQIVMTSVVKSLVPLSNVCLLVVFVVLIYAVIGLQMLKGLFHHTCFDKKTGEVINETNYLCDDKQGRQCPEGFVCRDYIDGPNYGITNFDNIYLSMLAIFQAITCEGWTDLMYWTNDVYDVNGIGFWFFYYSLHVLGARFMLNLVLGVLSGEFGKEGDRLRMRKEFVEKHLEEVEQDEKKGEKAQKDIKKASAAKDQQGNDLTENKISQKLAFVRSKVKELTTSRAFAAFMLCCVFLNTLSVATQHYNQPALLSGVQDIAGIVFIAIFFVEMCLNLFGLGVRGYFKSSFNTFDFVVVIGGIVELILYYSLRMQFGVSVLRALKLFKLFKFTRYWKSIKNLVNALLASIKAILSLVLLLALFLVIFALLGMTLFGGRFQILDSSPRTHFDDFWNAFLTVFQILTAADWNEVMYNGVVAYGGARNLNGTLISIYFVAVVLIGNYVLLNVFLAIAVDNLTEFNVMGVDEAQEEKEREESMKEIHALYVDSPETLELMESMDSPNSPTGYTPDPNEFALDGISREGGKAKPGQNMLENLKYPGRMTGNIPGGPGSPMIEENTLFIFKPSSRIRFYLHMVVTSSVFDPFILGCILANSLLIAFEDTVHEDAQVNKVLGYFDFFFTPLFALELTIKIVNYGLVLHKGAYMRSGWNIFDVIVVSAGIASLIINNLSNVPASTIKGLKILKLLRVLRPLKSVNKSKKLKAVFQCMIFSLKNVSNIFFINIMFLFVFSAMGVQLFSGQFSYCTDQSKVTKSSCVGRFITFDSMNYYKPIEVERQWIGFNRNFDNVAEGMITLFTSSTGDGWSNVMFNAIDATGVDRGPLRDQRPQMGLFFLMFVVVVSFFLLNIFVALIILTFQEQSSAGDKGVALDRNERNCLEFAMRARPITLFVPEDVKSVQYQVFSLVGTKGFDTFIMVLIILNTVVLMITFDDEPAQFTKWLNQINDWFNFLFTFEMLLKIFACGFNYFKDAWNIFDCVLVLASWGDFVISRTVNSNDLPFDTGLFRLFRALRLVKLLNRSKSIKVLLFTFIQSFKALPYVGALIFLLFFIYSVLGMHLFSHISRTQDKDPLNNINRNNHFRSFFSSFQVLFRCATGEGWPEIMLACGPDALCDTDITDARGRPLYSDGETCGSFLTYIYFLSFIFFCSFLMLNLFVAVIMDNFSFLSQDSSILGPHHLDDFLQAWAEFDPRGRGYIKHNEICELLRMLSPPLGMGAKCPKLNIYKRLIRMNMFMREDGTAGFNATLFHLCRTSLGIGVDENNLKSNEFAMRALLRQTWPNITKHTVDTVLPKRRGVFQKKTLAALYCAKLIYTNYKHIKKTNQKWQRVVSIPPLTNGILKSGGMSARSEKETQNGEALTSTDASLQSQLRKITRVSLKLDLDKSHQMSEEEKEDYA